MNRRQLLQAGSVASLGLTLPSLLRAKAAKAASKEISCIFIHQYGGLSQLDSWDMKPEAPQEFRGPYQSIATATPGFRVCELMPQLAGLSERYAVIRSMTHSQSLHDRANAMLLAGRDLPAEDDPAFGAIVARLRPSSSNIPDHIWLQKYGGGAAPPDHTYLTGGHLGVAYAPMMIGERHDENPANPDFRVRAFDTPEGVSQARLQQRRSLALQFESAAYPQVTPEFSAFDLYQQKSFELLQGSTARQAFDIQLESPKTRDDYGWNPMGQNLLLARRLIEAGVRLVNVLAWTGLAKDEEFVSVETWDMHGNADVGIFEDGWNGLPFALPRADQAVAALIRDLEDRGLLETTLVVFVGEFGRTPVIKKGAKRIGRDHWPQCYSAMLAGAGIQGGAVYGESDSQAAYVKSNPVTLQDFTATLLAAMDIRPQERISPDGFTIPASQGEPIHALL